MQPRKGPAAANMTELRAIFARLAARPPQLIVLPEAALTGYFLEGATFECALTQAEIAAVLTEAWRAHSDADIEIVCGFFEAVEGTLYNSAIALQIKGPAAQILHVHRKVFLPTYGVFDEARFLTRGHRFDVFASAAGATGLAICEDLWHGLVPTVFALKGARVLIVPSASPGRGIGGAQIESVGRWRALLQLVASEHGVFVLYCGLAGFEGGKVMSGGSCAVDPYGTLLGELPSLEAGILRVHLDLDDIGRARAEQPLVGDLHETVRDLWRDPQILAALFDTGAGAPGLE